MSNEKAKDMLKKKLDKLLNILSGLDIKPQTKLKILKQIIYPKISFELKIYDFASTWTGNTLDGMVHSHIRRWLDLPINTCIEETIGLPTKMCGLNIPSLQLYATKLRLALRSGLKNSQSDDIRCMWNSTMTKNINVDSIIAENSSLSTAKKSIKLQWQNAALKHVSELKLQGIMILAVIDNIKSQRIAAWSEEVQKMPAVLFNFVRKGLQQQLATLSNLCRWGKMTSNLCPLCNQIQTNKHILSNCSSPCVLQRYKRRHDAALYILCNWLRTALIPEAVLHADISGFEPLSSIFVNLRPDIAVISKKVIYLLELTICHETHLEKSRKYKRDKYANIKDNLQSEFADHLIELETIELSAFGLISDFIKFATKITNLPIPEILYANLTRIVIGNRYNIYLNRNSNEESFVLRET